MLTAQKENNPLENQSLPQRSPTTRSIDKVVNSIEGLRERVDGFTLEQVSGIDQRLKTMSLGLGDLQRKLTALTEIKQRMSRLQKTVQLVEAESLEQARLMTLVEPIAVHSIAQVGTLLKFRRIINLIKEAKSVPGVLAFANTQARTPIVSKPAAISPQYTTNEEELTANLPEIEYALPERSARAMSVAAISEPPDEPSVVLHPAPEIAFEPVFQEPGETISETPTNEQELGADLPEIEYELPEKFANETPDNVTSEDLEQTEAILHPAPTEIDFEPNEPFSDQPTDTIFFDDSTTSRQPQEIIAEFDDTRDESPPSHEAIFEEFKGTVDMDVHPAVSETETETTRQTHMAAPEEADFDQRLLDDLIKDYGEFTILPNSPSRAESKKQPGHGPSTTTPQVNAQTTVNLPTQPNLPLQRKDGELDRKLKKLIKDYGEYDLYSRQTPLNLKTGVVAAFLLLTLIFSGFYFFSSPKSVVPVNASSASPSPSSSETISKKTSPTGETNVGETPSGPSVSNVDKPKPVESGLSHSPANKGSEKKTK